MSHESDTESNSTDEGSYNGTETFSNRSIVSSHQDWSGRAASERVMLAIHGIDSGAALVPNFVNPLVHPTMTTDNLFRPTMLSRLSRTASL